MASTGDDDATIRIVRRAAGRKPRRLAALLALPVLLAAGAAGWIALRLADSGQSAMAPAMRVAAGPAIPLADEAAILAAPAPELRVFRFGGAPSVLVLSFPSLHQQGEMLNRVAAFVEKAGLPRERPLTDAELDAAIHQAGETPESYYYGHDYGIADIVRFFAAADRDGIMLNAEEARLRALVMQAGPPAAGALISIPPLDASQEIDATARAAILHHELSHGVFFTDPAYAAYARTFWRTVLNETQRAGIRRFLADEGYDTANEELTLNEAQAYLIHTSYPRYFVPERVGMTAAQAALLRETFVRGMPDGWLKAAARGAGPGHSPVNGRND
jgi:hypothetical protein